SVNNRRTVWLKFVVASTLKLIENDLGIAPASGLHQLPNGRFARFVDQLTKMLFTKSKRLFGGGRVFEKLSQRIAKPGITERPNDLRLDVPDRLIKPIGRENGGVCLVEHAEIGGDSGKVVKVAADSRRHRVYGAYLCSVRLGSPLFPFGGGKLQPNTRTQ